MKDVQETLDRLVPEPARMSDWDAVLREAKPRRRSLTLQLAAATGIVALAALFAVTPWKGSERVGILDRALAAVGEGPVLHVVLRGDWGGTLVDLNGGRKPLYGEDEIWYDAGRGLVHEISRFGSVVQSEEVFQPKRPDPVLTALSVRYREALKNETARIAGSDVIDGAPVYWITIRSLNLPDVADHRRHEWRQQVAVSKDTYKPVATRETRDGKPGPGTGERILTLETVPLDLADFTGSPDKAVNGGPMMFGTTPTSLDNAASLLGRTPLWLGSAYSGLPLAQTQKVRFAVGRSTAAGARFGPEETGVSFFYGTLGDDPSTLKKGSVPLWTKPHVVVSESTHPEVLTRGVTAYVPPEGSVVLTAGTMGYLIHDGIYISIAATDEDAVLAAARALRRMASAGSGAGG